MRSRAFLKRHLPIFALSALILAACAASVQICPFVRLLGIPCPTCGVTRAMVSLLMLDPDSYIRENFMAAFLVSAVWLCIHRKLFTHRKWIGIYTAAVLLVNTVRYGVLLLSILN